MNSQADLILSLLAEGRLSPEEAEALLDAERAARLPEVAVLGSAVRLPGADTPAELWRLLVDGRNAISAFPTERFDLIVGARQELADRYGKLRGGLESDPRSFGGWLRGIEQFEPEAFGLAPFEAEFLAPSTRLMAQLAREALEASGYRDEEIRGSRTGVFLAHQPSGDMEYLHLFDDPDQRVFLSEIPANVAYQVAYLHDLRGPVLNVDTTCSSSLTALHLARRSLQLGECDLAVVAGISVNLFPFTQEGELDRFVVSPRFRCGSYDAEADGIVWGEGGVAVVLKRLDEAVRDRDPVAGVLAGSAVASEGTTNGMAAPNPEAHRAVVRAALADAGLTADRIGYLEGHGTGTALGDLVEVDALSRAFREDSADTGWCGLGSVKSVLGHLGDAAGLAGFLAALLHVQHGRFAPVAGLNRPNPGVDWAGSPFVLHREPAPWPAPADGAPRRAGVSSLGISGTDVHVVVAEYQPPAAEAADPAGGAPVPVLLSARTRWALWELVGRLAEDIDPTSAVADIARTLAHRDIHPARLALVASDTDELLVKLRRLLAVRAFDRIPDHFYEQGIYVADDAQRGEIGAERLTAGPPAGLAAEGVALVRDFVLGAEVAERYRAATAGGRAVGLPVAPFTTRRIWPAGGRVDAVDVSELFFAADWEPTEEAPAPTGAGLPGLVTILAQPDDLITESVRDRLRAAGTDAVLVRAGDGFAERAGGDFEIALDSPEDYDRLWRAIGEERVRGMRAVVHASALTPGDAMADLTALERAQRDGVFSLFHLARSMQRLGLTQPLVLAVVSAGAQRVVEGDEFDPARVTSFGFNRVFSQEEPHVAELSIDHDLTGGPEAVAGQIVAELTADARGRLPLVAYRNGVRHTKLVRRRDEGGGDRIEVRPGGAYVVVGGTGFLGPQLARFLGEQGAGTVVLLSRSGLPPRAEWPELIAGGPAELAERLRAVERAEETGVRIVWSRCDVTDPVAVDAAFDWIDREVGPVHGGFTLAKQLFHLWISELDFAQFREGIDNRVRGTWLLADKLRRRTADFLVLFSSISSMSGTKGAAECASVNQYLDAVGPRMTAEGLPTYTVNLPLILDDKASFAAKTPIPPIDFAELRASFQRFFRDAHGLDVIAKLDLDEVHYLRPVLRIPFAPAIWDEAARAARSEGPGGGQDVPAVRLTPGELRAALAGAWRTTLGVENPAGDEHFFTVGGTSLSALRLVHLVGNAVPGAGFDVTDLYAAPTFDGQLKLLNRQFEPKAEDARPPEESVDELAEIFARVERGELGDEQAAELLANLSAPGEGVR